MLRDGTGNGGADDIALRMYRAASSGATLPGAFQRRDRRRPAAPHYAALQSAVVGVQPTRALAPRPGAPARRRRSAATPCRYGAYSVVTTTKLGSDDAARRDLHNPETRSVRGFSQPGAEESKSAGKCQRAKRQFFRASAKKLYPDVRPCSQGGIGCPVSGARVLFRNAVSARLPLWATLSVVTVRLL